MPDLLAASADGVLTLTFNRPDAFNAMSDEMSASFAEELESVASRPEVRAVVVTGAGPAFSAGADIAGPDAHLRFDVRALDRANRMVRAVVSCPVPVVAAVNGVAAGVGCSVALAADLVVASSSASFLLAFSRVGLMPDGGASLLVAASIGRARALRMALLAEPLSAAEAHEAGLVAEVVDDAAFPERIAAPRRTPRRGPAARLRRHQEGDQRRHPPRPRGRPRARAHRPDRAAAHRRRRRGHACLHRAAAPGVPRGVSGPGLTR